jgi:hypothetical protein
MKKNLTLILLVLLPFFLLSKSYHTIAIDGNASGWDADETFDNISHDGYTGVKHANFTWDADYIYVAVQDDEADYNNMATFIYFDTDPYGTLGTNDAYAWGDYIVAPFNADFVIAWKNNYNDDYIEVKKYNNDNSSWDLTGSNTQSYLLDGGDTVVRFYVIDNSNTREIKIKRSFINNPDAVKTCMFTEQQWSGSGNHRYMVWPSEGWTDANRAFGQAIPHYYGFLLEDHVSLDSIPYYDASFTKWEGTSNSNWSDVTNWTTGTPGDSTLTIIPSGNALTVDVPDLKSFDLTLKPGSVVTIPTGQSLTIYGGFYNTAGGGGMIVNSTSSGNGSLIVKGFAGVSVTAECYMVADKWHSFSAPVSGQTSTNLFLNHSPDVWLKEYHESTNSYTNIISLTQSLGDMQGWMLWLGGTTDHTFSFEGMLRSDTLGSDNNMVRSATGDYGYNFVGNPFTSAINWDASSGWVKTNLNDAIYVYNNSGGSGNWATYIGGIGTNGGSNYIAMNQGFFVEVADGGGSYPEYGTLKLSKEACEHNAVPFYKSGSGTGDKIIRLQVQDGELKDETVVRVSSNATSGFDAQLDAHKMMSFGSDNPFIFSTDNNKMSINSVPEGTESIPMDAIGAENHTLTISLIEGGNEFEHILLTDLKENTTTDLKEEPYTFKYTSSFANRFVLHFLITEVDNNPVKPEQYFSAFAFNKSITVINNTLNIANVEIFNLLGQKIAEGKVTGNIKVFNVNNSGYYLVKVYSGSKQIATKVWVE